MARVPRSVLRARRSEVTSLPLVVSEGVVPPELTGHVFLVAPVGTVATGGLPYPNATTIMNGDGMIVRLDLANGQMHATSRIARTSCFYADEATQNDPRWHDLKFMSAGLTRLSFFLGGRDFANTAFLPFPGKPGEPSRLLITYDAGRPWEIDTETLQLVTPMGAFSEWRAETMGDWPFPIVLAPAHPFHDPHARETFTVNYGRSMQNIMCGVPALKVISKVPKPIQHALGAVARATGAGSRLKPPARLVNRAVHQARIHLQDYGKDQAHTHGDDLPRTFTELVRWDGEGKIVRHPVMGPDGKPVAIRQSIHQIAVTKSFVVLLDTGFKIGLEQAFNDPIESDEAFERLLRLLVARPQIPNTVLWIISRADLEPGGNTVSARRVEIPLECDHFLADFADDGRRVTLHLAHCPATDLAEWVRTFDVGFYTKEPSPPDLSGMLAVGAMDLNRFGRYVVDALEGLVLDSDVISDDRLTWAIALFAGRGLGVADGPPDTLRSVYWCTEGFFPELLTHFVWDMYEKYKYRLTPLDEIRAIGPDGGRPSCVIRLDVAPGAAMRIADSYELDPNAMASSLQFVPRPGSTGDTDGWIVGVVFTEERNEVWVWDAADLARGPLCKLHHPDLVFGFSLHTAWLPEIARRVASYDIPVRDDLSARVPDSMRELFEEAVYPPFERNR